ncbi:hypothetical protein JCM10908_002010 [Rhodotorula pacifica]|uniref:uncharacterized protein n=1 Tax=Rhodotorula pacifica TaxID=1495444 RepID=UPI00317669A3
MSSQKSSKTDLLVRVRYQNPLPPPPFPPKLLHIPTTPHRYATYDFLAPIQGERELPMILDAELGMPLELGKSAIGAPSMGGDYWLGNRSAIAPNVDLPVNDIAHLADEDAFLFEDPDTRATAGPSGAPGSGPGTPGRANVTDVSKKVDVSWLRKTEYLSSEAGNMRHALQALNGNAKPAAAELDPLDRDGRAAAISATFDAAHIPLSELRHPTKRGVTAVESFDLLPDDDLWANEYDLVRFGEDPSSVAPNEPPRLGADPRLPRAIFRDLTEVLPEGQGRVAYYLPTNDDTALAYTEKRYSAEETAEDEAFEFRWVRDYEIAGMRQLTQEFIFSFDAGAEATEGEAKVKPITTASRKKGAYYTPLDTAKQLRKRRLRRGEDPRVLPARTNPDPDMPEEEFWDGINLQLLAPENALPHEEQARWHAFKAQVSAPLPVGEGGEAGDLDERAGSAEVNGHSDEKEAAAAPVVVEEAMQALEGGAGQTGGDKDNYGQSYDVSSSGTNDQGNHYCSRDYGNESNSYHYSNSDGSYYYSNSDGSTYHNDGNGGATYTSSSGNGWTTK